MLSQRIMIERTQCKLYEALTMGFVHLYRFEGYTFELSLNIFHYCGLLRSYGLKVSLAVLRRRSALKIYENIVLTSWRYAMAAVSVRPAMPLHGAARIIPGFSQTTQFKE